MAVERAKEFVIDLSGVVNARLSNFQTTTTNIRAKQDADFANKVLDQGITYQQQLDYYRSRLDSESGKDYPDVNYITTLKGNVSNLKKLVKYQKFNDQYTSDFNLYSTGKGSVDTLISEVQSMLSQTTDESERSNLQKTLTDLTTQKFKDAQQIINNKITLATNDQSIPVLNSMLSELQSDQIGAESSGNEELASSYALQIQQVKANISAINVQQKTNDTNLQVLQTNTNSIGKLDSLNNLISSSDKTTPIYINGTKYNSESEYWNAQKNAYLAGAGNGLFKDFFGDLKSETNAKLSTLSAASKNGALSVSDMMNTANIFTTLSQRNDMQPYANQLNGLKTDIMSTVATVTANAALSEYSVNQNAPGAYEKALQDLTNLQSITGVNQAININNLKLSQASASASVFSKEQSNPTNVTLSANQITQLKGSGYTDEQIGLMQTGAMPVPSNIKETTQVPPVDTTIPKTTTPVSSTGNPQQQTTPGNYQIQSGDTLSAIAAKAGVSLAELQAANKQITDPNKIIAGQSLVIPQKSTTPTPTPTSTPTPTPIQTTPQTTSKSYTVVKGDTLSAIAPRLGTTVQDLTAKNKISDPNKIQIGQQLIY